MIKIRKATCEDADKIAYINVTTWKDCYKGLISDALLSKRIVSNERVLGIQNSINAKDTIYWVAELNKEIVGFCCAGQARDENYPFKYEVHSIYVLPSAQNKGIGTALLNEFRKEINNEPFYLYALKQNVKAHVFYEKNGGKMLPEYEKKVVTKDGFELEEVLFAFN